MRLFSSKLIIKYFKNDYFPRQGYLNLDTSSLVPCSYKELNFYIGTNNSYNWRPEDKGFLEVVNETYGTDNKSIGLKKIDFKNEMFWINVKKRCFIPINLLNPVNLKSIIKLSKRYNKAMAFQSIGNVFRNLNYRWTANELLYLCEEKRMKRRLEDDPLYPDLKKIKIS